MQQKCWKTLMILPGFEPPIFFGIAMLCIWLPWGPGFDSQQVFENNQICMYFLTEGKLFTIEWKLFTIEGNQFTILRENFYHRRKTFTIEWKHFPYRENNLPLRENFYLRRKTVYRQQITFFTKVIFKVNTWIFALKIKTRIYLRLL